MLTHQATAAELAAWKKTFEDHRGRLAPNRRSGAEIAAYLEERYPVTPVSDGRALAAVRGNVLGNDCLREKLSAGASPRPAAFRWKDGETDILIGSDLETGYFLVEGVDPSTGEFCAEKTERLYDELVAFRGLDERDLENFYLVAEYVGATKTR